MTLAHFEPYGPSGPDAGYARAGHPLLRRANFSSAVVIKSEPQEVACGLGDSDMVFFRWFACILA